MEENKYLKQAREELAYLSGDPDFQRLLESRAGFLRDMDSYRIQCMEEASAEGEVKGVARGELNKQKEIAKKMKEKNMPIKDIIELTGLTKEEIEKL